MDSRLAKIKDLITREFNDVCQEQQNRIETQEQLIAELRAENGTVKQRLIDVQSKFTSVTLANANINQKCNRVKNRLRVLRSKYDAMVHCFDYFKSNFMRVLSKSGQSLAIEKAVASAPIDAKQSSAGAQLDRYASKVAWNCDRSYSPISDAEQSDVCLAVTPAGRSLFSVAALAAAHDDNEANNAELMGANRTERLRKASSDLSLDSGIQIDRSPEQRIYPETPIPDCPSIRLQFNEPPSPMMREDDTDLLQIQKSPQSIDLPLNLSNCKPTTGIDTERDSTNGRPNDNEVVELLLSIPRSLSLEQRFSRQSLISINLLDLDESEHTTAKLMDSDGENLVNVDHKSAANAAETLVEEDIDIQMEVVIGDDGPDKIAQSPIEANGPLDLRVPSDHHSPPITFECYACKKNFGNKKKLLWHMQNACNKLVKKRVTFKLPKKDNPHKSFQCFVFDCKKTYDTQAQLDAHMKQHPKQVSKFEEKPFVCGVANCKKAFLYRNALEIHSRIHTGERPFVCNVGDCTKTFNQKSNLLSHLRSHTGVRPHLCSVAQCGKRFAKKSQLQRHMSTHGRQRWATGKMEKSAESRVPISNGNRGQRQRDGGSSSSVKQNLTTESNHKIHIRIQDGGTEQKLKV